MRREVFSQQHQLFRAQLRRFAEEEIEPKLGQWEEAGATDRETWRRAGEEGFLAVNAPEDYADAAVPSIHAGSNEIMRLIIARRLGLG